MNREGSYYRTFLWWNKIVFGRRGYDRPWVAAHEYTHALRKPWSPTRWKEGLDTRTRSACWGFRNPAALDRMAGELGLTP